MTAPVPYSFRTATLADLPMLTAWQSASHVREWWDDEPLFDAEELADLRVTRWIVSAAGRPFAYIQDYAVHGWAAHHFDYLPDGARGIDQFIGEPDMVGQGHGTAFIGQHLRGLFRAGAPVVATDPHPDNARAIAVYAKLGFVPDGPPRETEWGLILPMCVRRRS